MEHELSKIVMYDSFTASQKYIPYLNNISVLFIPECQIHRNPIKLLVVWYSWNKDPALP